jgi:hypothetical protein
MTEDAADVAIPNEARSPKLREYLRRWAEDILAIKEHHKVWADTQYLFSYLCYFWLIPIDQHQPASYIEKHDQIKTSGFDGSRVKLELEELLSDDLHLLECCEDPLTLSRHIDRTCLSLITTFIKPNRLKPEVVDRIVESFVGLTYQQRFSKSGVSHLYNFHSDNSHIIFSEIQLVQLEASRIPVVIGDDSIYRFLHNHQAGDFFLITESFGRCTNVLEWLFEQRATAVNFASILQYFKDGVVHVDYTTAYFRPHWVNDLRRPAWGFIGEPRRVPYGDAYSFYSLTLLEAREVEQWWSVYRSAAVEARLADFGNKLRQTLLRAGDYYETSMLQGESVTRLVNLAIALEALYSPAGKDELSYRIALYASLLVSETSDERAQNFEFLRKMYSRRSSLFHGSYDVTKYQDGTFVTKDEVERLSAIIRESILRFLILYLRGESSRDNIMAELETAVLNPTAIMDLRKRSNVESFLIQFA